MVLRFHFAAEDLARTRVAPGPDPLWEVLLSVHLLAKRDGEVAFGNWRRHTWSRLAGSAAEQVRPLLTLAPPYGYSPDFLTPAAGGSKAEPAIDTLLSTPRQWLRSDLAELAAERRLPGWVRDLAAGDPQALRALARSVRLYFDAGLAPYWADVSARLEADRLNRGRVMLDGGIERLLATLNPAIRWEPPVLEVRGVRRERDIVLGGRGLLLMPSFFCWRDPITLRNPDLPPVLVYPVEHEAGWLSSAGLPAGRSPAHRLLGTTRAVVLEAAADGRTTTELARAARVTIAGASQHVTVLREAGLVRTSRRGRAAHHTLTPLGRAVLDPRPEAGERPAVEAHTG